MKPAELVERLEDLYRDKRAMTLHRTEGARQMPSYELNNMYQYVLARDEAHLAWLRRAIEEMEGTVPGDSDVPPLATAKGLAGVAEDDARLSRAFVDRWKNEVDEMPHARHRTMLRLLLGEVLEQARFFDQAASGRKDLLGRRADGAGTPGTVLPTRWLE